MVYLVDRSRMGMARMYWINATSKPRRKPAASRQRRAYSSNNATTACPYPLDTAERRRRQIAPAVCICSPVDAYGSKFGTVAKLLPAKHHRTAASYARCFPLAIHGSKVFTGTAGNINRNLDFD